ncbi:unnamed protein product [Gadus morhua 'NCC']
MSRAELLLLWVSCSVLTVTVHTGDTGRRWAAQQHLSTDGLCRYGNSMECCWGWTQTDQGGCKPHCQQECKHGVCAGPDRCQCHPGYTGKNCNQDLNECGLRPRPCKHRCMNTAGSYKCYCLDGYTLHQDGGCRDTRNCFYANCQYGCEVVKGNVRCTCPSPGLRLGPDRRTCVDIDECVQRREVCPRDRKCVNTFGSFLCNCPHGLRLVYIKGRYTCIDKDTRPFCALNPFSPKCRCRGRHCREVPMVTLLPPTPRTTKPAPPKTTTPTTAPPTRKSTVSRTTLMMTTTSTTTSTGRTLVRPNTAPTATVSVATTMATTTPTTAVTISPNAVTTTTPQIFTTSTSESTTVPDLVSTVTTAAITATHTFITANTPSIPTIITTSTTTQTPSTTTAWSPTPSTTISTTTTPPPTTSTIYTTTSTPRPSTTTTTISTTTTIASTTSTTSPSTTTKERIPPTTIATATGFSIPTTTSSCAMTTTLDNRINKDLTQRPRGDVHIPRQNTQVWEFDFDIELGNTAEMRDDPASGVLHCSMDRGVCDWLSDREGDLDWNPVQSSSGGWYLSVAELKAGQRSVRGARLAVMLAPPGNQEDMCFSFSHWLTGHHVGGLQLFIRKTGSRYSPALWSRTEGQGWKTTLVKLERDTERVLLRAERRRGQKGQIAVDDITLKSGPCR